jgi:hypothetical protein
MYMEAYSVYNRSILLVVSGWNKLICDRPCSYVIFDYQPVFAENVSVVQLNYQFTICMR